MDNVVEASVQMLNSPLQTNHHRILILLIRSAYGKNKVRQWEK